MKTNENKFLPVKIIRFLDNPGMRRVVLTVLDTMAILFAGLLIIGVLWDSAFNGVPDYEYLTILCIVDSFYVGFFFLRIFPALASTCNPSLRENLALTLVSPEEIWRWKLQGSIMRACAAPAMLLAFVLLMAPICWLDRFDGYIWGYDEVDNFIERCMIFLSQLINYFGPLIIVMGLFINALAGVYSVIAKICRNSNDSIVKNVVLQSVWTFMVPFLFFALQATPLFALTLLFWLINESIAYVIIILIILSSALVLQAYSVFRVCFFYRDKSLAGWRWDRRHYWLGACFLIGCDLEFILIYAWAELSCLERTNLIWLVLLLPFPPVAVLRLLERRQAARENYFCFDAT